MNLQKLRVFMAVIEHNSFSRAAEHLHVSQPAISRAIRDLEEEVGVALMSRGRPPLHMTEAGRSLYGYGQGIFALESSAVSDLRQLGGLARGSLVLGCTRTVATSYVPPVIAEYLRHYPEIDLQVMSENTATIEQRLVDFELDIGIVEGVIEHPRIELTHWCTDELVLIAGASHELLGRKHVSAADLAGQRWVMREPGSGTGRVMQDLLAQHDITLERSVQVGGIGPIIQCVGQGIGLSLVSRRAAELAIRGQIVGVVPFEGQFERPLYIARLVDKPLSPPSSAFIKTATAFMSDSLAAGSGSGPPL